MKRCYALYIELENDCFVPNPEIEVARILRELSRNLTLNGLYRSKLQDINGSTVGEAIITDTDLFFTNK